MKKFNVFINVALVIAVLFCTGTAVCKIRDLSDKTAIQKAKMETIEYEIKSIKEKESLKGKLKLKCSDKFLVFDAVNGIKTEDLESLEVISPYYTTLYQVIGKGENKEEKVLQNSKFEGKNFKLEGVTKEVAEIRLFGFDTNGDQVTSQTYQIVFLD